VDKLAQMMQAIMEQQLAGAASNGINSLWNISPVVTVLVLIVGILIYGIRALLIDAKTERALYRQTLVDNTKAFNGLQEVIRAAISAK
jgi:hypothetical protein